jgi:hypothetical protein
LPDTQVETRVPFPPVRARYVRFRVLGTYGPGHACASVAELDLFRAYPWAGPVFRASPNIAGQPVDTVRHRR